MARGQGARGGGAARDTAREAKVAARAEKPKGLLSRLLDRAHRPL